MAVYNQVTKACQGIIIAPARHALRGDIRPLARRLVRPDLDRERRTAIDIRERLAALEARRSP